jgi:hypothetical protein
MLNIKRRNTNFPNSANFTNDEIYTRKNRAIGSIQCIRVNDRCVIDQYGVAHHKIRDVRCAPVVFRIQKVSFNQSDK